MLLYVAFFTIMVITQQKKAYALLLSSRVIYSAQYYRQHSTLQAFAQFGALYSHSLDGKHTHIHKIQTDSDPFISSRSSRDILLVARYYVIIIGDNVFKLNWRQTCVVNSFSLLLQYMSSLLKNCWTLQYTNGCYLMPPLCKLIYLFACLFDFPVENLHRVKLFNMFSTLVDGNIAGQPLRGLSNIIIGELKL